MTDNQPDNIPDATQGEASGSIEAQPFSVGAALREGRTRLGLSVADVSHRIKFAPRQVEALEANDFARLPEITFVRGFVRSYARLLQLDPDPLLAALHGAPTQPAPLAPNTMAGVPFPNTYSVRKPNIIWLAAALAVAIAVLLFALLHGNGSDVPETTHVETLKLPEALPAPAAPDSAAPDTPAAAMPKAAAPAVPVAPPAKPAATSSRPSVIRMTFEEDSWVEITDKEGKVLLSQINPRGSEQNLNGKPPFSVAIGRASGVRLYYKGQVVDLAPHTRAEVARVTLE